MSVVPMHTSVLLDEEAIEAERRAQLAELVAERFGDLREVDGRRPYAKEVHAAAHLRRAARLSREAADEARDGCAHRHQVAQSDSEGVR